MINYNGRKFRPISNTENGEVTNDLIFEYHQNGSILYCDYAGEKIQKGFILGIVNASGVIDMTYQQINTKNELRTGKCTSTPEIMENGKVRLREEWQWTNGDLSSGTSILEELTAI